MNNTTTQHHFLLLNKKKLFVLQHPSGSAVAPSISPVPSHISISSLTNPQLHIQPLQHLFISNPNYPLYQILPDLFQDFISLSLSSLSSFAMMIRNKIHFKSTSKVAMMQLRTCSWLGFVGSNSCSTATDIQELRL